MRKELLLQILSTPTAPYRESHISELVIPVLEKARVPFFEDSAGNIVLGADSKKSYQQKLGQSSKEPLRIFVAHMDHPGFHGVRWQKDGSLSVKWYGGSPTQHLESSSVWLADSGKWRGKGLLRHAKLIRSGAALDKAEVVLGPGSQEALPKAKEIFGGFSFRAPVWEQEGLYYTKAADDLVGLFAIVSLAVELYGKKPHKDAKNFLGLLTRAEEVGFVGMIAHLELGWLAKRKRRIVFVSLETSRTLPKAEIGKGPVVRLGDRATVFDPMGLEVLHQVARKSLKKNFQKRIMDGGACEATAAISYGFPSVGISIPLGNYHNQSFEGGPDARGPYGPAPEFVHTQDVQAMIRLCRSLVQNGWNWTEPWKERKQSLRKRYLSSKKLLARS